jgi:cell division protein FtsW
MPLLLAAIALLGIGLVMVASASITVADGPGAGTPGDPFFYLTRQMVFAGFGVCLGVVAFAVSPRLLERYGMSLILVAVLLLMLVFIPGLGRTVNGSTRWIGLGPVNLQVSELAKLATVIYLAGYLVRRREEVRTRFSGFLRPMVLLSVLVVLLLLEPDFGAAAVMLATALGMMWLGGVKLWQFAMLLATISSTLAVLMVSSPYRLQRLTAFVNPWADPFNSGFQLTQALIAFGRGEWFGVGLGRSVQKLFYLPEAHTDFLFAVTAEELGLLGAVVVIALFAVVVGRALWIGRRAECQGHLFGAYLAYGLGIWVALQAFINIGVNMGVLPTKGLTLPFMSYGGSSLVVMCIVVALVLRVDVDVRRNSSETKADRERRRRGSRT